MEMIHKAPHQGKIYSKIQRICPKIIEKWKDFYTGIVLDHRGKVGYLDGILPIDSGMTVCGQAITCLGGDLTIRRMAINLAHPGDVLVVAAGGNGRSACFGDGTALKMQLKGISGVVLDSATRDAKFLRKMRFSTFSLGITAKNSHYPKFIEYGSINVPVVVAGSIVNPGDLILGDDDGVVVVPFDEIVDLTPIIEANLKAERIQRRSCLVFENYEVRESLADHGLEFIEGTFK